MLTVAGNRGPMMVNVKGFDQANTIPPKLTPEEEERRRQMLTSIRDFNAKQKLKHCQTSDRSGPIVSGLQHYKRCIKNT